MKPLRDLVVIELIEKPKDQKNNVGLFLPPPKWAKPENIGKVVSKGPEVASLTIGDYVLITPYAVMDTEETRIKIIREEDILCQVESPAV